MRIAGIDPAYEMKISFPQIFYFRGIKVRVWTDPKYKTIAIGFPDSMETFSRLLVKKGLAEDAMKWYLEEWSELKKLISMIIRDIDIA